MADMITVLNTILANGGTEYSTRVPQATRDNITAVGNAILDFPATTETFLNLLVNRIAMTIVNSKTILNPLSVLKKGGIPLGATVQELFTNPAKAEKFDGDAGATLLAQKKPDTKVLYHTMDRQDQYTVTFTKPQLKQAFTSWGALEELLNSVINSLYSGDNYDEFILTKNLLADGITKKKIKAYETVDLSVRSNLPLFVEDIRTASSLFQFPSSSFNAYLDAQPTVGGDTKPVITWTPKEDQILIVRADIMTKLDVNVLAVAFNMDKTTLLANTLEVDTFGAATNCYAVLADKSMFKIFDNDKSIESFYNPKGRYWNYFLNHWETFSLSLFANGVAFQHTPA